MLNILLNGLNKDLQKLIVFDLALFIVLITIVNAYKAYFLFLTCLLVAYLTYRFVTYFIQLSCSTSISPTLVDDDDNDENVDNDEFYEIKLANLLFKNVTIYRMIKKFSRNRFVRIGDPNKVMGKYEEESLPAAIAVFVRKFGVNYIEKWYHPFVSHNEQFVRSTNVQMEILINDLLNRVVKVDKLKFFADVAYVLNNNFINMAIYNALNNNKGPQQLPLELLHPAVRNSPSSEIAYIKRMVLLCLRKSLPNERIHTLPLLEELCAQMIGKNVLEFLIELLAKPNFLFFCIAAMVDKEKAMDEFTPSEFPTSRSPSSVTTDEEEENTTTNNANHHENRQSTGVSGSTVNSSPGRDKLPTAASSRGALSPHGSSGSGHRKTLSLNPGGYSFSNPLYESEKKKDMNFYFQIYNIKIVDTEISVELKSGKEFTLYNIQFEYRIIDIYANNRPTSELNSDCSFKKLKRRYKEFVMLQKNLEENPHFKHFLKHIKTPAKYLVLPIGNMDGEYVEKRRKRLNDYLNSLVKIPEICQSKELISFLELDSTDAFSRSSTLLNKFTGVLEKISPVGHFTRKSDELDLAIEFGKLEATTYDYTNHNSFEKFYDKLNSILGDLKTKELDDRKSSVGPSEHVPEVNHDMHLHFSKQALEMWNKAIISSSLHRGCWINNKNVYRLIEVAVCDFYVENYFRDLFSCLLSVDYLIIYLHMLEHLLFEKKHRPPINFDDANLKFKEFAIKQIHSIISRVAQTVIGQERFTSSITLLLSCLENKTLNKHILFSLFDLILMNLYGDEFIGDI